MPYTYQYARPALTVDCVVFGLHDEGLIGSSRNYGDRLGTSSHFAQQLTRNCLKVLLIQRAREPFAGRWALPGGFVDVGETVQQAAHRELVEETGLTGVKLEQLHTFSEPDRDPREHTVSVVHYGLVNIRRGQVRADDDARDAKWFPVGDPPPLAFDHDKILRMAHERLREKIRREPIVFELLPRKFTLSQLQHVYETIRGEKIDGRRFRRRILKTGLLVEASQTRKAPRHPAPPLYRFDRRQYRRLSKQGVRLEL
jgi:8-oxo-dGTP diphosphatase